MNMMMMLIMMLYLKQSMHDQKCCFVHRTTGLEVLYLEAEAKYDHDHDHGHDHDDRDDDALHDTEYK